MKDIYKRRFEKVIEALQQESVGDMHIIYDQGTFARREDCDTTCCIAGTALLVKHKGDFAKVIEDVGYGRNFFDRARKYLGLNYLDASSMFYGGQFTNTPKRAVSMLKHFIKKGTIPKSWWN